MKLVSNMHICHSQEYSWFWWNGMKARARKICFSSDSNHKSSMNLKFSFKLAVCIFIAFKFFNLLAEWNPCDFINCEKHIAENAMNEMKCNWNATNFQCLLCMTCVLYFWNVFFRGGGGVWKMLRCYCDLNIFQMRRRRRKKSASNEQRAKSSEYRVISSNERGIIMFACTQTIQMGPMKL